MYGSKEKYPFWNNLSRHRLVWREQFFVNAFKTQLGIVKSKFNSVKRYPFTAFQNLTALNVNC